jgi:CysZ protein
MAASAGGNEAPGHALPFFRALVVGVDTALLSVLVYLCAVPFLLVAESGFAVMFLANAYLLGRVYFLLAAMRFRPLDEAKAMCRAHRVQVFLAGLLIAVFVSIPIVNLATPLFAMAMMVHVHKRLSQRGVTFQTKLA